MAEFKALLVTDSKLIKEKMVQVTSKKVWGSESTIELESLEETVSVLSRLSEEKFDVVVLDLSFKREDASDIFHTVRNYSSGFLPIVVLSTKNINEEKTDQESLLSSIADGHLFYDGESIPCAVQLMVQVIKYHTLCLELNRLREEQEKYSKMAALGMVTANIAHEINNPLAITLASVESLMNKKFEAPEEQKTVNKASEKIFMMTTRVARIVKGLNSYLHKSLEEPAKLCRWKMIVDESLSICKEQFVNAGIEVIIEDIPDVELVCQDLQLSQVLLNLFNNARDAALDSEKKWIRVSSYVSEEVLYFLVTDSGRIHLSSQCKNVFEPFYSTKKKKGGMGLGLSLSKKIVKSHGGDLELLTEMENTTFRLSLPLVL